MVNFDQIVDLHRSTLSSMALRGPTTKEVCPIAYPKSLRLLIREKLESGALPRNGLRRVWGGPGNGESCIACNETIAKTQFVMEGMGEDGSALQFHVACFSLWNAKRTGPAGVESEG